MRKSNMRVSRDINKTESKLHEKSDMPITVANDIIRTTSNMHDDILNYRFNTLLFSCLNSIKNGSSDEKSLATKAIGLLALKIAQGKKSGELLRRTVSTFSNVKSEDVTVQMLGCLTITTLAGATGFSEIERSMKIIWEFICSLSTSTLKSKKDWALVMSTAISTWSLLLTMMNTEELVALNQTDKYWNGVMTRIIDMLQEEKCIRAACVGALSIICEKGYFEPFSGEEHYNDWTVKDWKDEVLEQVAAVFGWKSKASKYFKVDFKVKLCKKIFEGKIAIKSWSQLKKIEFVEEFLGDDFTLQMMENKFIQHLFEVGPNVCSFRPKLYAPVYDEVEDKGSLRNIRNLRGSLRKMELSSIQKDRSRLRSQRGIAKMRFQIDMSNY